MGRVSRLVSAGVVRVPPPVDSRPGGTGDTEYSDRAGQYRPHSVQKVTAQLFSEHEMGANVIMYK